MSQELTAEELWTNIKNECEGRLNKQTIATWLSPSRAVSVSGEGLTVELKNKFTVYYVEQNYQEILDQVAGQTLNQPFRIEFVFADSGEDQEQMVFWQSSANVATNGGGNGDSEKPEEAKEAPRASFGRSQSPGRGTLSPRYSFEHFVVGRNNQFAHAAALSVAEAPANRYNPLFIYGGVGLGKTHLMQAIGHSLIEANRVDPGKVCYISAEEFLNELVSSIAGGSTMSFRNRYRQMDILLIDDVEFLARKEGTQEEFFHTFNSLYENQKQIVLTSDRPPREIQHLEERLRSRFQWGLVTDIQAPEYETRIAILKRKSALENLLIPEDVLDFIAESITGNVRLLECSLNSLKHYSATQRSKIDIDLARMALESIFESGRSHLSASDVISLVAEDSGLSTADILSAKRKKSFVEPRQTAMFICNKLTKLSLPEIAESFRRKDHTTVLHAVRKIEKICGEDNQFKERVYGLMDKLRSSNIPN